MKELNSVISHFLLKGTVSEVKPLGSGLINDSYLVTTSALFIR